MTDVHLIDQNAIWYETADLDIDLGRPANSVLVDLPEFDRNTHFAAWSGDEWLIRPIDELPPDPVIPNPVPEAVTMRQARLALSRAGVLKAANDAIEAMEGQPGEEARIEWDYAAELRRDHPLVAGLGQSLGLDDSAIDNLFREAQTL